MNQPDWIPAVCEHFGWDAESWSYDPFAECWHRLGEAADGEADISIHDYRLAQWDVGSATIADDVRDDVLTTLRALAAASEALEAVYAAARVKP